MEEPTMSYASAEASWLEDDDGPEGYVTEDRAQELFLGGLQAMREMLARFVEQSGDPRDAAIAESIRANWNPSWGKDPGRPETIVANCWEV
jgi:hypothetical protein